MYLMMRRVFDELGYRRYEWKCDALNAPSRAAAQRLGFQYEGMFRQATVYKARNRDTCWFSILDSEWPALKTWIRTLARPRQFRCAGAPEAEFGNLHRTPAGLTALAEPVSAWHHCRHELARRQP